MIATAVTITVGQALGYMFHNRYFTWDPQIQVAGVFIPILQMRKLRLQELQYMPKATQKWKRRAGEESGIVAPVPQSPPILLGSFESR